MTDGRGNFLVVELKYLNFKTSGRTACAKRRKLRQEGREQAIKYANQWAEQNRFHYKAVHGALITNRRNVSPEPYAERVFGLNGELLYSNYWESDDDEAQEFSDNVRTDSHSYNRSYSNPNDEEEEEEEYIPKRSTSMTQKNEGSSLLWGWTALLAGAMIAVAVLSNNKEAEERKQRAPN